MSQKNTAIIKQNYKPLIGTLRVPSDKSITQRAYIFGAMANGVTTVNNPLNSADAEATLAAVISMGAELVSKTIFSKQLTCSFYDMFTSIRTTFDAFLF